MRYTLLLPTSQAGANDLSNGTQSQKFSRLFLGMSSGERSLVQSQQALNDNSLIRFHLSLFINRIAQQSGRFWVLKSGQHFLLSQFWQLSELSMTVSSQIEPSSYLCFLFDLNKINRFILKKETRRKQPFTVFSLIGLICRNLY